MGAGSLLGEVGDVVGLNDEADLSGVESSGKLSTAQGFRKVRYSPGNYASSPDSHGHLTSS